MSSVLNGLRDGMGVNLDIADYQEHAIGHGADVQAAAYVECRTAEGQTVFGVGIDADVATASVKALLSAAATARG
jgi:2-isopropylmalate synthase